MYDDRLFGMQRRNRISLWSPAVQILCNFVVCRVGMWRNIQICFEKKALKNCGYGNSRRKNS